jgi:hypothetical protein
MLIYGFLVLEQIRNLYKPLSISSKYGYVETEYHTITVDTIHGGESGTLAA